MMETTPVVWPRTLIPTDFSSTADQILDLAVEWVKAGGGEALLMHGVVLYASDPYNPAAYFAEPEELYVRLRDQAQERLEARSQNFAARGIEVTTRVERGYHPAELILAVAEAEDASLILLGTHGHTGPARLLMGSTAAEVVRRASCPVLTVRQGGREIRMPPRKILLAVDFSKPASAAVELAIRLARGFQARLEVLHVLERFYYPGLYGGPDTVGALAVDYDALAGKVEPVLEELLAGHGDLDSGILTRADAPGPGIVAAAEDLDADLVVVGSRGMTGFRRWILGSTAEYVVRHSPYPVLTVKPDQEAAGDDDGSAGSASDPGGASS